MSVCVISAAMRFHLINSFCSRGWLCCVVVRGWCYHQILLKTTSPNTTFLTWRFTSTLHLCQIWSNLFTDMIAAYPVSFQQLVRSYMKTVATFICMIALANVDLDSEFFTIKFKKQLQRKMKWNYHIPLNLLLLYLAKNSVLDCTAVIWRRNRFWNRITRIRF